MSMMHLRPQLRALRLRVGGPVQSTSRACDWSRVRIALRVAKDAKRRVRVYAGAGFVPNSYKWRCNIQYIELAIKDGRIASITAGWTGAQRSYGRGNLVIVQ